MERCKRSDTPAAGCVKEAGHGGRCKVRDYAGDEFTSNWPGRMVPYGEPAAPVDRLEAAASDRAIALASELAIALGYKPLPCQDGLMILPDAGGDRVLVITPSGFLRQGRLALEPAAG